MGRNNDSRYHSEPKGMLGAKTAEELEEEISLFDQYFADTFMGVLNDAAKIYASHIPEKGESWILDSVDDMLSQWIGEVGEVLALFGGGKYSPGRCKKEILDVINMSLMVIKLMDNTDKSPDTKEMDEG